MDVLHIQLPDKGYKFINERDIENVDAQTIVISGPMAIAGGSFSWNKTVRKIVISDDVTGIDDNCFIGCDLLEEISFGRGLQYIGDSCFRDLKSLKNLVVPGNIRRIGKRSFGSCSALQSLVLSEGIEAIGDSAFSGCMELAGISFPKSVKEVGSCVFDYSKWFKNQPEGFIILGRVLFAYTGKYLESIKIPDAVEYIAGYRYCLGRNVDYGLNTRVIPSSMTADNHFLETAVFHDKLERIEGGAFSNCNALKMVTIPSSVYYIGWNNFKVEQLANAPEKGCVFVGKTVYRWMGETKEAVIPEGPETISPYAFSRKKKLKKVVIPSTVRTLYYSAFSECSHLEIVAIPDTVNEIHEKTFVGCSPFTIVTSEGSFADQFAKAHGIPIVYEGSGNTEPSRTQQEQDDQERILAIQRLGGRHLQNFIPENRTSPVCLAAVTDDGSALEFVPEKLRTKEIYAAACKSSGTMLRSVPEKFITTAMCKAAVMNDGLALCYVPEKYMTEQLCLIAVKKTSKAINYVPARFVTPAFCAKAGCLSSVPDQYRNAKFYDELTDLDPDAFWYMPKQYRTATICKKYFTAKKYKSTADAVKQDDRLMGLIHPSLYDHETSMLIVQSPEFRHRATVNRISYISNPMELMIGSVQLKKLLQYPDVFLMAFELNIGMIAYVPEKLLTPEMLMKLMDTNYRVFPMIPEELKTKEICVYAVNLNPEYIKSVPNALRSEELCLTAVRHNSWYIQYVPETVVTYEMCEIAAKDNARGVRFIPPQMYDKELALLVLNAVIQNQGMGYGLEYIPVQLLDYDMCMKAVSYSGQNLQYIPERIKDYDLCLTAVRNKPEAIDYVPSEYWTPEMALAVAKNAYCFKKIPKCLLTEEVCLIAVRHQIREKGTILVDIPHRLITQEICDQAFETSVQSIEGIPDEFVNEGMLYVLAKEAPWELKDHFPARLRSEALFKKLTEINPKAEYYIQRLS